MLFNYFGQSLMHQEMHLNDALKAFERASELFEKINLMNEFMKAKVLLEMQRDGEALEILLELHKKEPTEAELQTQIGMVYKKLGNP
jgi:predicted Zn-dependent protease